MQGHADEIRRLGGEVLAVHAAPPGTAAAYLARHPLPFPAVSDPTAAAHRAFGLGRTSWREFLRPAVLGRYLALMFRGWLPAAKAAGDDLLQLGGDFVLDGRGRLAYAYRSRTPTDRPPAGEVVEAVRRAAS